MVRSRDGKLIRSPRSKQQKNEIVVSSTKGSSNLPSKSGSTMNTAANIRVVVRVRPSNSTEQASNHRTIVQQIDEQNILFDPKEDIEPFFYQGLKQPTRNFLKRANKQLKFVFNNVFYNDASNEDVFEGSTKEVIDSLFEGYNCSVFAYGATGAGKTYTMIGTREHPGITYLTMQELFRVIESHQVNREFDICVSYLEVYNENVYDLLQPNKSLVLREDSKYGVIVSGLTINKIETARELLNMLEVGNKNRTQHPTDANAESSRSHAVFQVYVKMTSRATGQAQVAKLSMIDLAGSERAAATNCSGDRFKEGANINRSLLALGNCINQLADGSKFIPYRDSKLTRLLKDSLGGNCRTVMIANVSPSSLTYDDTYNTLKYASRASKIQLHMKKNVMGGSLNITHYVKRTKELTKEIEMLKKKLAAYASGGGTVIKVESEDAAIQCNLNNTISGSGDADRTAKLTAEIEMAQRDLNQLTDRLLQRMIEQRCLLHRACQRQTIAKQLESLAKTESNDSKQARAFKKEMIRQEAAVQSLTQRASDMQKQIEQSWKEYSAFRATANAIFEKAVSDCPHLLHFVEWKKCQSEFALCNGRVRLLQRLSSQIYEEVQSLKPLVTVMPRLLRQYYLYLKGYGKITMPMEANYKSVFKKLKLSRSVSWKDDNLDIPLNNLDPHFSMLNLELANPTEMPSLPDSCSELSDTISDVCSVDDNIAITDLTDETPSKRPRSDFPNDTIILNDSLDDHIVDTTQTISASQEGSGDIFKVPKEINPNNLNSTFVLAQKNSLPLCKKLSFKTEDVLELKKLNADDQAPIKMVKPVFRNPALFKTPNAPSIILPTSSKENKAAFGSTVGRFPYPGNASSNSLAAATNKGMRSKSRAQNALPYARINARLATPSSKNLLKNSHAGTPKPCAQSNRR